MRRRPPRYTLADTLVPYPTLFRSFKGLNARSPWMAGLVLCIMASMAGVPPFLGFWAKLAVLRAAIEGDMLWLAIVGIVFAVIVAFYRSEEHTSELQSLMRISYAVFCLNKKNK